MKSMTQKPSPNWERGDRWKRWVRDCLEQKCEEFKKMKRAPHPAFGHLLPEGEDECLVDRESWAVESFLEKNWAAKIGYLRRAGTVVLQKQAEDTKKGKRFLIASLLVLSIKLDYFLM